MKKMTKMLSMLMITVLSLTMLMGCGGPKLEPDESAKIVLDIVLKADNSRIADVGMTQEEFNSQRKKIENSMETSMSQAGGSYLSENSKKAMMDGILAGMKKMEYTTKVISKDKKTATVEVSIKSFDMTEITNKLKEKVQTHYMANPSMSQSELFDYTFEQEAELLKQGIYKSEPTKVTIKLTNKGKVWAPNDDEATKIGNSLLAY